MAGATPHVFNPLIVSDCSARPPSRSRPRTGCTWTCASPGTVADEVERLKALGAKVIRVDDGLTVMADPEGNEFCVE
jgi:hypothetical protein